MAEPAGQSPGLRHAGSEDRAATDRAAGPRRGLSTADVLRRGQRDGPNELPAPRTERPLVLFARQLTHLLAVLLWIAAALALVAGMPALAVAISVIVVLNGLVAFWQEHRADRSTQQLRTLLPSGARVIRNGSATTIQVRELVVGDLAILAAGDRVGADMRVLESRGLLLDESLMTGESGSVSRTPGETVLAGSFVVSGEGEAEVTATGPRTRLAEVSQLTASAERPASPLTLQLRRVVRVVAVVAAVTGTVLGVAALALGLDTTSAFLFAIGVAVALVPEGLLPTVTLSLARGAQQMAGRKALVRRLDAVETLGATTFICTDKTGTLTQNRMNVVEVVLPDRCVHVSGSGYEPVATFSGDALVREQVRPVALSALACVTGRVVQRAGGWVCDGDPMDGAIHALALRSGADPEDGVVDGVRRPFTAERLLSSSLIDGVAHVLGAPERVLARCLDAPPHLVDELDRLTTEGRRVLAVARRTWVGPAEDAMETGLTCTGLLALEDPPRPDVGEALRSCRQAGISVAMLTGDHVGTARSIAREVGLLEPDGVVLEADELPEADDVLAELLDNPGGTVVARVSPADKLRIARAVRSRGHVVAMTGDGVNDAPALREADVGVAMGATGSDVARESADLVLLDDSFTTMVAAIELGRATFQNVRRFLTFHLTDNVAELAPFAVWALTGGNVPLAIGVLQVLALDIGTDMLPALALGAEPPRRGIMHGRRNRSVVDRAVLTRAFLVLGATEAMVSMAAFLAVLLGHDWSWGATPTAAVLAQASGTVFATIAVCQMVNSVACRSTSRPVWRLDPRTNRFVLGAVLAEALLLLAFLGLPPLPEVLGGSWPGEKGWLLAVCGAVVLMLVDGIAKARAERQGDRRGPRQVSCGLERGRRDAMGS